jgi:hypothetical protein
MVERQISEEMEWFEEICLEIHQKLMRISSRPEGFLAHQAAYLLNFRLRRSIDCYAQSGYDRFEVRMTYTVESEPIDPARSKIVGKMFLWESGSDLSRSIVVFSGVYRIHPESSPQIDWNKEGF